MLFKMLEKLFAGDLEIIYTNDITPGCKIVDVIFIPGKFHDFGKMLMHLKRLSRPHDHILKTTHNSQFPRMFTIFVFYR